MSSRQSDIEPPEPGDVLVVVRVRAKDWDKLAGPGLELDGRLQFIHQPEVMSAGNLPTYGIRFTAA